MGSKCSSVYFGTATVARTIDLEPLQTGKHDEHVKAYERFLWELAQYQKTKKYKFKRAARYAFFYLKAAVVAVFGARRG